MTKLFIIPDAHAHPEYDNERFDALGEFMLKEAVASKGDMRIICLGDFADMPSLSSYDKGTKGFEGRRYDRDVEATHDASERLFAAMYQYNHQRARNKKSMLFVETTMTLGNHEDRINRAVNAQPELDGKLGMNDLQFEHWWDTVVPYREITNIQGFAVSHSLPSGVSGRPVGGANLAARLLTIGHCSSIVGHSHTYDTAERTRYTGEKMLGINAGCFVHPDFREGWCANTVHMWWRGITIIDNASCGFGDIRQVGMDTILRGKF